MTRVAVLVAVIATVGGVQGVPAQKGGRHVPVPADFLVTYEFRAGSVPPPYYYQYTITIGANAQGEVVVQPDYDFNKPPTWRMRFSVSADALTSLYQLLNDRNVFDVDWPADPRPKVGGEVITATITADRRHTRIATDVRPERRALAEGVFAAITSIVPRETWTELEERRKDYEVSYGKRLPK